MHSTARGHELVEVAGLQNVLREGDREGLACNIEVGGAGGDGAGADDDQDGEQGERAADEGEQRDDGTQALTTALKQVLCNTRLAGVHKRSSSSPSYAGLPGRAGSLAKPKNYQSME